MGDRANVKIIDGESTVFLYTHNTGTELPKTLQAALIRGSERLDDGPYLARIIFAEMTRGFEFGLTGFGISSVLGDGYNRVITIDIDNQTVQVQYDRAFPLKAYAGWRSPRWLEGRIGGDDSRPCPRCRRR